MKEQIRILVVDDDAHLLRTASRSLRQAGYEVLEAATGADGLQLAREEKPDLVLLDAVLPDIDGPEVCRLIKAEPALAGTLVILLSGVRMASDNQAEDPESGADGYLGQPIANRELLAWVGTMARLKQAEAQRDAALEALQESEDKFKHTFEHLPIGISITLPSGEIQANRAFYRMLGYPKDRPVLRWQEITHPDDLELNRQVIDSILSGEKDSARFIKRYIHRNGSLVWAEVNTAIHRDEKGQTLHFVTAINDITERVYVEEALRRSNEELAALHTVTAAVSQSLDLKETLGAALEAALTALNAEGGLVYLFDETSQTFAPAAHRGISPEFLREVTGFKVGEGLSGQVAESGEPLVVADVGTDPRNISPTSVRDGWHTYAGVPVRSKGKVSGMMILLTHQEGVFAPDHVSLLGHIGDQIGVAIENARLYEAVQQELAERKRAEEALRESEERYRSLFEGAEDHIFILDQDFRYVMVNQGALKAGGFALKDVVGKGPRELFPEDAEFYLSQYRQVFETGKSVWFERELKLPGDAHWFSVTLSPIKDAQGRVIALTGISRDITERKQAEDALRRRNEELKETQAQLVQSAKLAAIGELAAGVAHEINNPLTSVLGFAELLSWELAPSDPIRQELEIIVAEAKRTRDIVRNLLEFARQTRPLIELADVNHVLRQTLALIRAHVQNDGVLVEERYASDLGRIPLDVGQVKQVFLNLITNAAHAMPDGGMLTVSTAQVGDQVAVRITDTGTGIPPQDRERIFEPFFTTKPSGTGLGLSVSLGIVQQHGGRIEVESQVGEGSTFTVWLPAGV